MLTLDQNILFPQLGAAGTTYARSVRPSIMPPGALPDPNLVYDAVMKRGEFRKHPNNVSSVLWYWATIIIHGKHTSPLQIGHQLAVVLTYGH